MPLVEPSAQILIQMLRIAVPVPRYNTFACSWDLFAVLEACTSSEVFRHIVSGALCKALQSRQDLLCGD